MGKHYDPAWFETDAKAILMYLKRKYAHRLNRDIPIFNIIRQLKDERIQDMIEQSLKSDNDKKT